jgi:hypothetical protein
VESGFPVRVRAIHVAALLKQELRHGHVPVHRCKNES